MVLRHFHHTTDTEDIKKELLELGHVVRNIINVRHRQTKEPLNLFYIDLEPDKNNKDIYNLTAIQNKIIYFETPRTSKHHIPQCTRFQQYGHMQKYCNKPYACIKCGGHHNSAACTKPRDTPAKCALCRGAHPANYKGCGYYHTILKGHKPRNICPTHSTPTLTQEQPFTPPTVNPPYPQHQQQQQRSYADVLCNSVKPEEVSITSLKTFLDDLKGLFSQLIHQNGMIVNMLSTLLKKHR